MEIMNEVNKILKEKNINIVLTNSNINITFKENGLYSLASKTINVELEEKIDIVISEEKLMSMKTPKDIIDSVKSSMRK